MKADKLLAKCFPQEALTFYNNMAAAAMRFGTSRDQAVLQGLIGMAVTLGKGLLVGGAEFINGLDVHELIHGSPSSCCFSSCYCCCSSFYCSCSSFSSSSSSSPPPPPSSSSKFFFCLLLLMCCCFCVVVVFFSFFFFFLLLLLFRLLLRLVVIVVAVVVLPLPPLLLFLRYPYRWAGR